MAVAEAPPRLRPSYGAPFDPLRHRPVRPLDVGTALVLLLIGNEFSGFVAVLGPRVPGLTFTALLGLASLGVFIRLAGTAARAGSATRFRVGSHPPVPWVLLAAMAAYVLANALSATLSSIDVETTAGGVLEAGKELLFLMLLCLLGVRGDAWTKVAAAIVVPMSIIGLLAGVNEFVLGGHITFLGFENLTLVEGEGTVTGRHAGPLEDANFWGRLLVVGVPFALAMATSLAGRGRRLAAAACAPLLLGLLLGIYLTSSRGAFLAAGAATLVFAVLVQRHRRVVLGALAFAPLALLLPGVGSRLGAVLGLFGSTQYSAVDSSVIERLAAQQVALRMIAERPLTGVGPGGYMPAFSDTSALTGLSLRRIVAPHNGYLGTAAEIGLIGAACWLFLIGVGIVFGARSLAALRAVETIDDHLSPYVAATLAAIAGWCVATIFLHVTYHRVLLILLALAALQHPQALRLSGGCTHWAARRLPRRAILSVGALTLAGALTGWGLMAAAPEPGWAARAEGHLQPAAADDYLIGLRSRERVVPTFALLVLTAGVPDVDAQGDPQSGLIALTATGEDETAARGALSAAVQGGRRAAEATGLDRLYELSWGDIQVGPAPASRAPLWTGALAGLLAGLLLSWRALREGSRGGGRAVVAPTTLHPTGPPGPQE